MSEQDYEPTLPLTQTELRNDAPPATPSSLQTSPDFFDKEELSKPPAGNTAPSNQLNNGVAIHSPSFVLQTSSPLNAEFEPLLEQADSLDDSDEPFSQELQLSHSSTSSCEFQAV